MTLDMAIVFAVTLVAVVLFVTSWIRYDLVAILVMVALPIAGIIDARDSLAGFGNPAVITIVAVLVLSGGLQRTGIADKLGRHVLGVAGPRPLVLTALIMLSAGLLGAFMNNIAVVALMLPAVMGVARRTSIPPSKLLIPLAFGSLLGGLTTLIATAPNILLSESLSTAGEAPFQLFDFTPVGVVAVLVGTIYMTFVGRRWLPDRDGRGELANEGTDLLEVYDLSSTLFALTIPEGSILDRQTLTRSRIGTALGLNVLAIEGQDRSLPVPDSATRLRAGDKLYVQGSSGPLGTLQRWKQLTHVTPETPSREVIRDRYGIAEAVLAPESKLVGRTIREYDFRRQLGLTVIAIARSGQVRRTLLADLPLEAGDAVLVVGPIDRLDDQETRSTSAFRHLTLGELASEYQLQERLLALVVPPGSWLDGQTLADTRLGNAFDLSVLEISNEESKLLPGPDTVLHANDTLLISGREEEIEVLEALQDLEIRECTDDEIDGLLGERMGIAEVTLAPRTTLLGKTLREVMFRERYQLTVLSIWRGDQKYASNVEIRHMRLQLGDALLVYGPPDKLALLARDPDFIVLTHDPAEVYRTRRMPVAAGIMGTVVLPVALGWLPIYLAAPAGALAMILSGCLTHDEAYRFIDWKVVVLVAGMLSVGTALQETGAAALIADRVLVSVASAGSLPLIAALFLITALSAQIMPTTAVAVLMAPIALSTANQLGLSPQALMMVVAVGASCAFMSPVGHPVNLLVMGFGGYRFTDYTKAGLPLLLLMLLVALIILPIFWPLTG